MEKGMGINGEIYYIHCGGCDGLLKNMILTVLHVSCGVV